MSFIRQNSCSNFAWQISFNYLLITLLFNILADASRQRRLGLSWGLPPWYLLSLSSLVLSIIPMTLSPNRSVLCAPAGPLVDNRSRGSRRHHARRIETLWWVVGSVSSTAEGGDVNEDDWGIGLDVEYDVHGRRLRLVQPMITNTSSSPTESFAPSCKPFPPEAQGLHYKKVGAYRLFLLRSTKKPPRRSIVGLGF